MVIVIFGLLMTRQILFFDVNVETIFFIITGRSWIWYNLMDFVEVYRKNNCRVAVKVSLYTQHPDGNQDNPVFLIWNIVNCSF